MIPLDHYSDGPGCRVGYFRPEGSGGERISRKGCGGAKGWEGKGLGGKREKPRGIGVYRGIGVSLSVKC
ncbi:hypothetical protein SAMN06295967_105225 [Belliella buryatensis]|uniref:Uncharacterized protein n=1 Tax=Belliella buryatensis TaxID=1500549 RepID=A0A239CTE3_9BACT|nr:hypothetical protein SAMN06295967_105225 [Belliella buryatensis]